MTKYDYDALVQVFLDKDSILKLLPEEFEDIQGLQKTILYFTAKCGHDSHASFTNFKNKNTGVICRQCSLAKDVGNKKLKVSNEISNGHITEQLSFQFLSNLISHNFLVEKTNEGCQADMVVRPKDIVEDQWLKIQLKATKCCLHGIYNFKNLNKDYTHCLIVLISLSDGKVWIIPYEAVKHLSSLSIGKTNSIYNKYLVNQTNIISAFNNYYNSTKLFELEQCKIPRTLASCQELLYAKRRIERLEFFSFEKPQFDGTVYDFIMNGFKHQEKVSTYVAKKNYYVCQLCKHGNNEKQRQYYQAGDNDFYWLWIKDSTIFYVVPDQILLDQKCIVAENETKEGYKMMCLYPHRKVESKYNFLDEYKFDLDNLNQEQMKILLKPTGKELNLYEIDIKKIPNIFSSENYETQDAVIANGNDNHIENCDEQIVDTLGGENKCIDCNTIITRRANRCEKCYRLSTRKADRPSKDVLLNDVKENGYSATGRKYGVSDNAIRKWLK